MAGRSNLQQAVPITFGYKMATVLGAFERHRERLAQMRKRVEVGEFGGAAGTLSSLGKDGLKVQAALMKELKLGQPDISWHTVRDRIAEVGCFLGLVTGTCGKIAFDVKLLMQTEVEEVMEPYHAGRGSSSTMPQKRNPISSVYITAQTAMVKQLVAALLEAQIEDHERSTGPVGDRMDRAAGDFHAVGRRAGADPLRARRARSEARQDAREPRHHQRPDHVGGGDDGARRKLGRNKAHDLRLRYRPQGGARPASTCSMRWKPTRTSASTPTARR